MSARDLLRFELRYQALRPASAATFAATVLLLSLVPLTTIATTFGPEANAVNGAFVITETVGLLSLVSVFALPMLCVSAALRDDEHGMRDVIMATPASLRMRLAVRFVGVLLCASAALAVAMLVLAASPFLFSVPAERLQPFLAAPYLRAALLLLLPNLLWTTAVVFAVASLSRSTLAAFVAGIAIYMGYMVTALMVDSPLMAGTRPATPELMARAALLDPFGLSAFFEQTRYLTPDAQDAHALALEGRLLVNRLLVTVLACAIAIASLWNERRRLRIGRGLAARANRTQAAVVTPPDRERSATTITRRPVSPTLGLPHWVASTGAILRTDATLLLASWPLRVLAVLWVVSIAIEADGQLTSGEYGTRVLASTAQLADAVPMALQLLGTVAVLYCATELFARERLRHFDGVRDATPVANSAILTGKTVALLIVPVLLALTGYGTTVVAHLLAGGLPIEWGTLSLHVIVSLVPLVITSLCVCAFQVLVGQRWLAMFVSLALLLFSAQGAALGAAHPLLRFGAAPSLTWSDLDGFGTTFRSWGAFQAFWALVSVTLLLLAAAVFARGATPPLWQRLRMLPRLVRQGLSPRGRVALALSLMFTVSSGAALAYVTTVRHVMPSDTMAEQQRARYERRYRRLARVPQPALVHVDMDAALFPRARRAHVASAFTLVNRTEHAVDTLWLTLPRDPQGDAHWRITQLPAGVVATHDSVQGVMHFALPSPLAPGDTMRLSLALVLDRSGVRAVESNIDLTANGSFLVSSTVMPVVGYAPQRELQDSVRRQQLGLGAATPEVAPEAQADSVRARVAVRGPDPAWFTTAVRITTDADQVALGPGTLEGRTFGTDRARVTYAYRTRRPHTPLFAIVSGRYVRRHAQVGGTIVEVWSSPAHSQPAARLLQVTQQSLASLQRHFGPYPHEALRVVEVQAGNRFGAYAMAGAIYLTETRGMLSDARDGDVDLLLRRIGHEVAHQWWGHALSPIAVEGRLMLVETIAKYAEQVLVREARDEQAVSAMVEFDRDRYRRSRRDDEPPLVRMDGDASLYYAKGALAFQAMRQVLGDRVVSDVLREVLQAHAGERGGATAAELVQRLRTAAGDPARQRVVDAWFLSSGLPSAAASAPYPPAAAAASNTVPARRR
jgi:hypothetical protein